MVQAERILEAFGRESGRSAFTVIDGPEGTWSGGVREDLPRPAASLLKLPLAMATEPRLPSLAAQRVGDLLSDRDDGSVLQALDPDRVLSPQELLRLMLSTSDNPCARWALRSVGREAVVATVREAGAHDTAVEPDPDEPGMLRGRTTAVDAVALLRLSLDPERFPVTSSALAHSIRNSRIPLGVTDSDVHVAHKTGTLAGVGHDVAHLRCREGDMWIAFLCEEQHDILVTGYDMGICTRALLECSGLRVERTVSAAVTT